MTFFTIKRFLINKIVFLLFIFLLSGCANISRSNFSDFSSQRQYYLWNLQGAMAFRTLSDSGSVSFKWEQLDSQHYIISLLGPLGGPAFILKGEPGRVELTTSRGERFIAATPEALLEKQLHWHLPVSYLYYWIRGLPVPGLPAEQEFDSSQRLIILKQQNWVIKFLNNRMERPAKLELTTDGLVVKIVLY